MKRLQKAIFVLTAFTLTAAFASAQGSPADVSSSSEIWTGPRMTFTKADGADPTVAANQDRISDSVWITRGNAGGQIFNIQERSRANKTASPVGTQWAIGTTDNLENLSFGRFRAIVGSPQNVVGRDLVMHIIEEDIYIDVRFTSWSTDKAGGFAYERSTPAE
jgi:hypothetical protein